ncbi:MAG: type II toxin-antitoxin system HipA family toxin [Pseudomonadota bacterium]
MKPYHKAAQKIKLLFGSTPQGHSGVLARESQFQWRYDTQHTACSLSLAMPVRYGSYASSTLHPIFAMNLPEGEQFFRIRTRFAKQFAKLDEMTLLSIVGHNQIGRVRLTQDRSGQYPRKAVFGLEQLKGIKASDELFDYLFEQYFDAGISGVQPKFMIPDADMPEATGKSTARIPDLIIKTGGLEYPNLSQNEFVCMSAARKAGLEVPEFHLSNDAQMFIMRRFDLVPQGENQEAQRLGFEDIAALTGAVYDMAGDYKYQGNYEGIVSIIGRLCQADPGLQKHKFFEQLVLSIMVRNGDAHLKNFGLLYQDPSQASSIRLAPLFDVVTTSAYDYTNQRTGRMMTDRSLALKLNKSRNYPDRRQVLDFGRSHCGIQHPELIIERISQAMSETLLEYSHIFPHDFARRMNDEWQAGRSSLQADQIFMPGPGTN